MSPSDPSTATRQDRPRDTGVVLIAAFKLVKAILLLAVGFGAIGILHEGTADASRRLLATFSSGTDRRLTEMLVARLAGLSALRVRALGIGAFLYAALFLVEATGLWLQTRWAEYLTLLATASFIPFEIYELVRAMTVVRAGALAVNIAVVGYLLIRLRRRAVHARTGSP